MHTSAAGARAPQGAGRRFGVSTCTPDAFSGSENCPFGPDTILPSRLGAQTVFAVDESVSSLGAFNAATFLRAFSHYEELARDLQTKVVADSQAHQEELAKK